MRFALALVLASALASAQATPGSASLSFEALQKAAIGAWAEYAMSVSGKGGITMRYSLVEKSAKAIALEIETTMPPLVMRMDFQAASPESWKISRIRMRMGDGPVQEVPPPEGGAEVIKKGASFGKLLGAETLKTAAGSFECKRYKQTTAQGDGEVWMSDKALPSGLVQTTVSSLGAKITLTAIGNGASAKIK